MTIKRILCTLAALLLTLVVTGVCCAPIALALLPATWDFQDTATVERVTLSAILAGSATTFFTFGSMVAEFLKVNLLWTAATLTAIPILCALAICSPNFGDINPVNFLVVTAYLGFTASAASFTFSRSLGRMLA